VALPADSPDPSGLYSVICGHLPAALVEVDALRLPISLQTAVVMAGVGGALGRSTGRAHLGDIRPGEDTPIFRRALDCAAEALWACPGKVAFALADQEMSRRAQDVTESYRVLVRRVAPADTCGEESLGGAKGPIRGH